MTTLAAEVADNGKREFQEWAERVSVVASRSNPGAFRELLEIFYEQGWAGKEKILSVFRDKPDSLVYESLEKALRDHVNAGLRNAAMEVYAALGGRSLPPLVFLLRDADEEVRCFACVTLGNLNDKGATPELIRALSDTDLNVKHAAAEALGKIRDISAVEPLIEALSTDMWLQFPAAIALGDIGDPRAVRPLIGLLDIPGANVPAIQALGKLGDPSSIGPLSRFLEDEEPSLREWALEAVAAVLSKSAKNPGTFQDKGVSQRITGILIEALKSDSYKARRNAVVALGCFKVKEAVPALTRLLADRDLREDALEAIVRIGGEGGLDDLAAFTKDSDPLVRRAAAEALSGISTEKSRKLIMPLLSDSVEEVRVQAALSLARFGGKEASSAIAGMISDMTGAAHEAEKKAIEAFAAIDSVKSSPLAFDPLDVIPLRDYISDRLGLYYDNERLNVLYHRLSPLAAGSGYASLREYLAHLVDSPGSAELLGRLACQLANNETYFFREKEQLAVFIKSLLPNVLSKKLESADKKIRILSAGCSTGEEAYTLAILLEDAGARASGCNVEIVGVDIDSGALEAGRHGRYPARSFRGGENGSIKRHLKKEADWFVVNRNIRSMVNFRQGNMLEMMDIGRFDIIFCRNVLIYFSDSSIQRVAANFYNMLIHGGYLFLGHSESLCRINADFTPVRLEGAVVYQKK